MKKPTASQAGVMHADSLLDELEKVVQLLRT